MDKDNLDIAQIADVALYIDVPESMPQQAIDNASNMLYRIGEHDWDYNCSTESSSDEGFVYSGDMETSLDEWLSIWGVEISKESWGRFYDNLQAAWEEVNEMDEDEDEDED